MLKKITCLIVDDEPTAREILHSHLSKIEHIHIIGSCESAVEAFNFINEHPIDLIFLDINMPKINGISFAKTICKDIKIIFTTAYREYAIEGFDLQAVDYLLKPISLERLYKAVNLYAKVYQRKEVIAHKVEEEYHDFIFVKAHRKMVKINFSDIFYIESLSDYLKIHITTGIITTRETISNIEAKLPTQNFIRVHRSFIISISHIRSYTSELVEVEDQTIPIGRSYKAMALNRLESSG